MKLYPFLNQVFCLTSFLCASVSANEATPKECADTVRSLTSATRLANILRPGLRPGFYMAKLIPEFSESAGFTLSHEYFLRVNYGDSGFEGAPEVELSFYASENPRVPGEPHSRYEKRFGLFAHANSDLRVRQADGAVLIDWASHSPGRQVVEDATIVLLDHRITPHQEAHHFYIDAFQRFESLLGRFNHDQFEPANTSQIAETTLSKDFRPNFLAVRIKPRTENLVETIFVVQLERK